MFDSTDFETFDVGSHWHSNSRSSDLDGVVFSIVDVCGFLIFRFPIFSTLYFDFMDLNCLVFCLKSFLCFDVRSHRLP